MGRAARTITLAAIVALLSSLTPAAAGEEPGTTRRLADSSSVVSAAIQLSQAAWRDGTATVVALGRDDVFSDSLAGAALAGTDGPVLFTTGGADATLPAAVRAEIERVLPGPSGCDGSSEIAILGGTSAVSSGVESELDDLGYCVERFAGATRTETAVRIAEHVLERGGDAGQILVSRSDTWPDSATGSAYAAATGHPIVVTAPTGLDPVVASFLDASNPGRIVLLGGTAALSQGVADAAAAFGTTTRVAGSSRDATAVAIADELWAPLEPTGVALVNGYVGSGWAYAIAGAVNAALEGAAQLFVDRDVVPASVDGYLGRTDDTFTLVTGPSSLVSDAVVADVESSRGATVPPGAAPMRYRDEIFDDYTVTRGISYGSAVNYSGVTVDRAIDVYEPAGDTVTRRPAVVFVHGGGFWLGGRGEGELSTFEPLIRRGFVVASIDYRLLPQPGCAGAVEVCLIGIRHAAEDAQAAVAFVRNHASTYGIDPDRIAIEGTSAGAITALNVAYSTSETPASAVRAAVSIAGAQIAVGTFSAGDAPALLFHAEDDATVPFAWAEATVASATAAGLLAIMHSWPTGGHATHNDRIDEVSRETASFLWWQMDLRGAAT